MLIEQQCLVFTLLHPMSVRLANSTSRQALATQEHYITQQYVGRKVMHVGKGWLLVVKVVSQKS